ncbi:hypothetical protein D9V32_13565 [Mycetocola tolaasinivorans]|uniref:Uncharacterized protein n=1 Tax=Mycetocola tolaasinivorans TaxID=76635 RepID=A0A3L7A480_9MICO|nr:hypothetical protein [Mycetocola tolaasinivorans]RLP74371.1 hypothetical protein D9V32_13565 [Mycetocola tolaasinivorans]
MIEALAKIDASFALDHWQQVFLASALERDRHQISDSINRWAGHPEQTIRGAGVSVVLIDETHLLRDVAVRRPWWKFWAR